MLLINGLIIAGGIMIILDMYNLKGLNISWLFYYGYLITISIYPLSMLLSITLLSKIVNPKTRGTMFAFNGLAGSCFVAI